MIEAVSEALFILTSLNSLSQNYRAMPLVSSAKYFYEVGLVVQEKISEKNRQRIKDTRHLMAE